MLVSFLHANTNVFAWKPIDMPGVPREKIEHSLNVSSTAKPIKQKLLEIQSGSCGNHVASRSLVGKAFRASFYWPTAITNIKDLV